MITIDVTGRTPIYEQICKGLCGEISMGLLKENDRIPPARGLAKELGINPNTVAKAYAILERDGVIYSVAGKGCFVAEHSGKALEKLTEGFALKAREVLKAGVALETLTEILYKENKKLEDKTDDRD